MSLHRLNIASTAALVTGLRELADSLENGQTRARNALVIVDDRETDDVRMLPLGPAMRTSEVLGLLSFATCMAYEDIK